MTKKKMKPPPESKITISTDQFGAMLLALPHAKPGVMRYGVCAFMIFWLGGWAMGWISAFHQITSGSKGAEPFLVFWLCGWTVGGAFAGWWLWRMLRRAVPETLLFSKPDLIYDTGVQPFQMSFDHRSQMDIWKRMFEKRKKVVFTLENIRTVRLRDTDCGNRLTIDQANQRIDLGKGLTEVEREWLCEQIKQEYKL